VPSANKENENKGKTNAFLNMVVLDAIIGCCCCVGNSIYFAGTVVMAEDASSSAMPILVFSLHHHSLAKTPLAHELTLPFSPSRLVSSCCVL